MSVEQLVDSPRGTVKKTGNVVVVQPGPEEFAEVYTNIFIQKEGLGAQNEKSKIDTKPMRIFLNDATRNVLEVMKRNPTVVPEYVREILSIIAKGKSADTLSPEELNTNVTEALKSDKMKELTRKWQDEQLRYRSFALGFHWATDPEADRNTMATAETIHTGKNEGNVHKGLRKMNEYIDQHPSLRLALTGLSLAGGTLAVTGSPELAALTTLGAGTVYGIHRLERSWANAGESEIKSYCSAALRMLQSDPEKAAYIKAVSGTDVFDFVPGPDNQITLRSGVPESTRVTDVEKEVRKGVEDRRKFWEDLTGRKSADAMADQFLFRFTNGQQEQTGARMAKRIQELFKPNTDGIQDMAGQYPSNPFFGREDISAQLAIAPALNPANIPTGRVNIDRDRWGQDPRNPFYGRENGLEAVAGAFDVDNFVPDFISPSVIPPLRTTGNREAFLRQHNIPDRWGQRPIQPDGKPNPYYGRRNGTGPAMNIGIDFEGNLKRYDKAYQTAITEEVRELTAEIRRGNFKKDVSIITEKANELKKPDGKIYKEREKEIDDRKKRIETDRTSIEAEKTSITDYQTKIAEVELKRREYKEAYEGVKDTSGSTYPTASNAITELTKIRDTLTGIIPPPKILVDSEPIESIPDIRKAEDDRHAIEMTRLAGLTGRNVNELKANEITHHKEQLAEIKEKRDRLNERIKQLSNLPKEIENKEKEVADTEQIAKDASRNLEGREQDYKDLLDVRTTAGGFDPGRRITERDLREKPMEDIMRRINELNTISTTRAAFTPYPPYGWSASENDRPENRIRVERAIMEARARKIEPAVDTSAAPPDFTTVINPSGTGGYEITENQLRTLTRDEIITLVDTSGRWTPAITGLGSAALILAAKEAQIEAAIDTAKRRTAARLRATDEQIKVVATWSRDQDRAKEILETTLKPAVERLQVTADVMNNVDKTFDLAQQIVLNRTRYLNVTAIRTGATANANFTATENTLNAPTGYYEILDSMLEYRKRTTREEDFRKISAVLSPAKMVTMLNESLGTTTPTLDALLGDIDTRLTTTPPTMDYMRLQRAFDHIVETLYNEGIAL